MPRRSRSGWNAASPSAICVAPSCSGPCWSACVSYEPGPVSAAVRIGKFASSRAASPESRRPKSVSGYFAFGIDVHLAVLADEPAELAAQLVGLLHGAARLGEDRVGVGREPTERADRVVQQLARHVPDVVRAEAVVGRARQRRHRHAGGRERREEGAVEREALHRVLLGPDHVEQATEPAGARLRVERTDLPEVARREVGLVGVGSIRSPGRPSAVRARGAVRAAAATDASAGGCRSGTPVRRPASARASCAASGSADRRSDRGARARPSRRGRRSRRARDAPPLPSPRLARCPRRAAAGRGPTRRTRSARPRPSARGTCDGRGRCRQERASRARSPAGRSRPRRRLAEAGSSGRTRCSSS